MTCTFRANVVTEYMLPISVRKMSKSPSLLIRQSFTGFRFESHLKGHLQSVFLCKINNLIIAFLPGPAAEQPQQQQTGAVPKKKKGKK